MSMIDVYQQIPFDLSGSMSKNRFRQELFWGISKMFDLYDKDDFCVVFDYKCDVEVHLNNTIQFYQIKTHKVQSPYTFSKIKKIDGKQSIIAKLFLLQDLSSPSSQIKCALVSNSFFKIGNKIVTDVDEFCFDDLDPKDRQIIERALQDELKRKDINLANIHYIYTSMDLLAPESALRGKITGAFEKIKGCEPIKPNALFRLIVDTVQEKACYEMSEKDYDKLLKCKGFSKYELDNILDRHMEKSDDSVNLLRIFIDNSNFTVKKKKDLKVSLAKMINSEYTDRGLSIIEDEVAMYISSNDLDGSFEQIANNIFLQFKSSFPLEYTETDAYVYILLVLKRWEEGKYE